MSQLNTDPKVRDEALKKALIVRRERATLKASVAQKELTFTEALFVALAISPKKRISGLSDRQYEALKSWGEKDKDKGKDK